MPLRRPIALVALLCAFGWAAAASADITTERGASILVWPKIIANGTRDTWVQITNTSNSLVRAHCFYVNAALTNPDLPQGPLNPPLWLEVDFTIQLTRQQPTQWLVSQGRVVNPLDEPCDEAIDFCPEAGIDPGRVPPVVADFVGELKCVEVDDSGAPVSGNHLLGLATIFQDTTEFTDEHAFIVRGVSKYNAIGVLGDENNGDNVLVLGGGQCAGNGAICQSDEDCGESGPCAEEYNACPQTWILNHLADGAPNPVFLDTVAPSETDPPFTDTELTVVPCTQNFETQIPTTVTLQFITTNEFESQFSVSTSVTCWGNFRLGDIGALGLTFEGQGIPDPQGTMFLQTRMRPAGGTPFGVMMVGEEFQFAAGSQDVSVTDVFGTTDAANLHIEGERSTPDLITIPADQLEP